MPNIDRVIKQAVEGGYSVHVNTFPDVYGARLIYKVFCPDGCGYGRGFRIGDIENPDCEIFTGALDIVARSILVTLEKIPKLEADPNRKHTKVAVEDAFA